MSAECSCRRQEVKTSRLHQSSPPLVSLQVLRREPDGRLEVPGRLRVAQTDIQADEVNEEEAHQAEGSS